jgi:AcrR family transcriptional regulator
LTFISYVRINSFVRARNGTKSEGDCKTAERLLDTAERLFGKLGYDGVGMRLLAEKAGVNLGAATYHFGSKKELYLETFFRRFRPTEAERLRMLGQMEADAARCGTVPTVEQVVECIIRPPFLLGLKYPNFHQLMTRNMLTPPPFLHAALEKELFPNMMVMHRALVRALPQIPETLVHLRMMFSMGGLLMFNTEMHKGPLSRERKYDEAVLKELIRYVSSALQSLPASPAEALPPISAFSRRHK